MTPPVQVIWIALAAIELPPVPVIAAPVTETEAPPLSDFVLRKTPASVAVFEHATIPVTELPTAHVMFEPLLYVTPSVASADAVTPTLTL